MKYIYIAIIGILTFTGCARVNVLEKNKYGITIEHSKVGKTGAFEQASVYCKTLNKTAIFKSSSKQFGPDNITSWECKE